MRRIAIVVLLLAGFAVREADAIVPAGFEDSLVASVASPTAIAFTPDGRLLITTQPGRLRIYQNGALLATPALDLASVICSNSERGLLGVAVDPSFATNGYIYLFYTFNKSGSCAQNTASAPVNRVSRFTLSSSNTVGRASELILIDNIPSPNGNHNGGDLQIGRDGHLYVSVGDGGCDWLGNSGCAGANDAARDRHVLLGKILRITRTGGIPSSNPFLGSGTVRCNVTGSGQPGQTCQETFAWGLRNPFRIAFDPNATGTRFFINDVGQAAWEEIDEGLAGADYGWNVREGHCANGSTTNCGAPPTGMTNPIFDYSHADGCASITGGAFVPNSVWPSAYQGTYLFSDYVCGTIFRLTRQSDGTYTRTSFATSLGGSSAVAMTFGPHNGSQALYYTTYASGGQVRRIATAGNRSPIAVATASPTSGPVPLTVRFDAGGSSDPDGNPLAFEWAFGDGTPNATGTVVTHTYSSAGRFTATLTARDGRGGTGTDTEVIQAGNTPPSASISSPSSTARFAVGQTITLTGTATDAQDGTLAASRLSWTVLLHHDTHTHPYFGPSTGNNLTFTAPAPEDFAATSTSFLEIYLTATDSAGATTTVRRDMQPRLVSITFDSSPAGLSLTVNGTSVTTPRTVTSWERYALNVRASTQRDSAGQPWLFSSWSDGGAAAHTIQTPAAPATYTATFVRGTAITPAADTYARNGAYAAQNFGTATSLNVKHSSTLDNQRQTFIRFALGSGTINRAVLRLHGGLSSAGSVPVPVHPVASTTWSETALTWNTRPPRGSTALASATINSTARSWYEWDVTSYVRAERAAGRAAVGFVLLGTIQTTPYATFSSRQASSNRPELIVATGGTIPVSDDIVLYGTDASAIAGAWRLVADSTAAGSMRIVHPDGGAPKLVTPLASPTNYAEWSFHAVAGRPYRLWIRGKADANRYYNDSAHVQFSGSVTSTGAATFRIGTTSSTAYVLEECAGCGVSGWGWSDNGYGGDGPLIYFATTGPQTMRIQTREDGLGIDQIILSPTTYRTTAPGAPRNDSTIVPKP
jgi:glucose/arabinose dehydrogenase